MQPRSDRLRLVREIARLREALDEVAMRPRSKRAVAKDRAEFAAMVRGVHPDRLRLVREIARLREALDDIAMGASRRVAFEALKDADRHA